MIQTVGSTFVVLLLTVLGCRLPSTKGRQILLLAVSYLFYANWGIGFLSILIISSLMNYTWGCALRRKATTPRLWIGIALNLLPLAFFKYLPVLLELGPAGSWQYDLGRQIILPVGMSFWTFQGLSYFFDFAGYSHMVIGTARIFAIRLPENFDRPFFSTTPSIFWTRWHMSLSFWIRDYVFNPLAAAGRRYRWWPYVVFIIAMTFFGLWHA